MNFGLSDEQELLQETVRGFVANECPPKRLREIFDSEAPDLAELWSGLAGLGVAGLVVPEAYGGAELELLDLALVSEVLGAGALPGPFLEHSLATLAIALGGSEEQRERWLPALSSGERIGSIALAEPGGRWEPESWSCSLESGRLSGKKSYVPGLGLANLIVVGTRGGALAVLDREADGVKLETVDGVDRTRRLSSLTLEGACAEPLATPVAGRVRDAGLVLLAADAFGGAWRLVEVSIEYAKTREQFGQPIAQFQAVKHRLADMALDIEPTRGLYWYAAHAFDHLPEECERTAALAKAHISDRFMQIARDAVEVHGGIGFTWECDVQIWFKRAMFDRTFLGEPARQRERAARLAGW